MIVIDKEKLEQLGQRLKGKFNTYATERRQLEIQWLKNLRQYKSIYDSDVKIPDGMSKVYPKDTHTKIVGWVAKIMEMMFPAQEKNYSVKATPFPNILQEDLQAIIDTLTAQQQMIAQQQAQQAAQAQPPQPPPPVQPVTPEMIEKAIKDFAEQRAARMELECDDQLADKDIEYPELCKKVVRRGGLYGFGVAEGPQVKFQDERTFEPDATGAFVAVTQSTPRPFYTVLKAWDTYPDLSAEKWDQQEGIFTRKAFSRHGLRKLADDPNFIGSVINDYLRDQISGNYKVREYETELNVIKKTSTSAAGIDSRKYEVIRWYGFIAAQDLNDVGVAIPESALNKDILADVWLIDDQVIKADTAPFGEGVADMFHVFVPDEDEDGPLTGTAKVELLRDSQLKLCSVDRMLMDNMSESARSVFEVNDDLIDTSKQFGNVSGGMTIHRTGDGNEANYPAVRIYDIPNHTPNLLQYRKQLLEVFDAESHLQSWTMGNAQPLGEAFRTSNNMSLMKAGGDMVTKDDVRSFDRFVKSLIGSLVRWNMEFNSKPDIKGDFQVMPKGNMSLVAKEVRGAALDQLTQTLTPRDRVQIDDRKLLIDRLSSRDLPTDYLLPKAEADQKLAEFDQQQAAAAQVQQGLDTSKTEMQLASAQEKVAKAQEITQLLQTKVQKSLSEIAQNLAKSKGIKDGTALQQVKLLLDQINAESAGAGTQNSSDTKTPAE